MADQKISMASLAALRPAFNTAALRAETLRVRPEMIARPERISLPQPQPRPAPPPVAQPIPPPVVPPAPAENSFADLPFPSPGDRIKAEDFKRISQSLLLIHDALLLSASLLGRTFGEAKQALVSQQYEIQRVMSVFGNELAELGDASLDSRKVIQVVPLELGTKGVAVVLTEAVETRRSVPNLMNLTYREASERLQGILGDVSVPSNPMTASQLVGLSLDQAKAVTGQ
ncbi:MAG TPA: hypothetical protein VFZ71_02890 [Pyrinomonadaceae bacterium]